VVYVYPQRMERLGELVSLKKSGQNGGNHSDLMVLWEGAPSVVYVVIRLACTVSTTTPSRVEIEKAKS